MGVDKSEMNKKAIKKHQLYDLDRELAKIILQALKDFRKLNQKSVYAHVEDKILAQMIEGFEALLCEAKFCKDIDKFKQRVIAHDEKETKALKLFAKHFRKLWI